MPPLLADFIHNRVCELKCEKILTLPDYTLEEDAFCRQLGNAIRSKLGIEFNHQPVEYIFRVRKK